MLEPQVPNAAICSSKYSPDLSWCGPDDADRHSNTLSQTGPVEPVLTHPAGDPPVTDLVMQGSPKRIETDHQTRIKKEVKKQVVRRPFEKIVDFFGLPPGSQF